MSPHLLLLQRQQTRRDRRYLLLLAGLFVLTFLLALLVGDTVFGPKQWLEESTQLLIWQLRLPRALAVVVVGASLAVSGAVMQAIFDNPLAEPGLLGVSNGAGLALVLTILVGGGLTPVWIMSIYAIIGALCFTIILLLFSQIYALEASKLLLVGFALGIISSAVMTWMVYFSSSLDLRQLMYWLMGSFSGVDWRQKWLIIAMLPSLSLLIYYSALLNVLALGDHQARQLGVSVFFWRNILILCIAGLVGVSVAIAGVISFIGLVVPHILRLSGLTNSRYLLTGCALAGAIILLFADLISRTAMAAAELPIGAVTATLGAPLFIWMLLRYAGT